MRSRSQLVIACVTCSILMGAAWARLWAAEPSPTELSAGQLRMTLARIPEGIGLLGLLDAASGRELLAAKPLPLFRLTLRHAQDKQEVSLVADAGWQETEILPSTETGGIQIRWRRPQDQRLGDLAVVVEAIPDAQAGAVRWKLAVENLGPEWSVWRVVFPQLALADLGDQAEVVFPRGSGEVQRGLWQREYQFRGTYPSGWTSMPWMAAYDRERTTGLYFAVHDPWGSTKEILVEGRPADRAVVFAIEHPAPDMGKPGNGFRLAGEAVWQILHGDWFDAATIYGRFVRAEAKWFPQLSPEGRADTPQWTRELPVWVMTGGAPEECEAAVARFAQRMGVPVGFHWYNWHQIPFDNDYPHYFPTKPGFAEAVARLQKSGVFVMPYINGRLWDTRDKGAEDFEFTRAALPAATKDEGGQPYVETYGSKESDGSPVRLAAMCPSTELWQTRVRETVLRLFNECGVKAVYIDQIAAADPRLCFDATHGHPLGGGHWWTESYWQLLEKIRQAKPADRMLTTECNGEAYVRCFDGYLTWHWQYDGQVPAFPTVYGGSLQMFGRAYRGGPTEDLALRMKAGQQLVFGEQIGWFHPSVIDKEPNFEFLRNLVRLRWQLRRYFYAGTMGRPPKLLGEMPKVRADWQWSGQWWVTTDAVLSGAWCLPREKRAVLLLVNVGEQAVTTKTEINAAEYGLPEGSIRIATVGPDGQGESATSPGVFQRELSLAPGEVVAWELTAP